MKKSLSLVSVVLSAALILPACSNWNRATPKALDNTAIEEEVRKNLAADGITGLSVDVNSGKGVVTLKGHLSASDRAKAVEDARKVKGVSRVVDEISVP
jgi:osmotically-inducible protein OsmY